jgi:hypothetical protein
MKQNSSCTRRVDNHRLDRRDDGDSRGCAEHWASGRSAVRTKIGTGPTGVRARTSVSKGLADALSGMRASTTTVTRDLTLCRRTITHTRVRTLLALIVTMRPQATDTERMCS